MTITTWRNVRPTFYLTPHKKAQKYNLVVLKYEIKISDRLIFTQNP